MSFPTKKIKCSDLVDRCHDKHEIQVACVKRDHPMHHVYAFIATIADVSYEHRMTVGPVDGTFITPDLAQLQSDADAARKEAARHAHLRHVVSELEDKVK